jgi:hypothetical protein
MTYRELDTVVVTKHLPALGLRSGDIGTVVQTYKHDALEVEFVTASWTREASAWDHATAK